MCKRAKIGPFTDLFDNIFSDVSGVLKGRVVISGSGDWALIAGRKPIPKKRHCLPVSICMD